MSEWKTNGSQYENWRWAKHDEQLAQHMQHEWVKDERQQGLEPNPDQLESDFVIFRFFSTVLNMLYQQ